MTAQGWHALLPGHIDTWQLTADEAYLCSIALLSGAHIKITLMNWQGSIPVNYLQQTCKSPLASFRSCAGVAKLPIDCLTARSISIFSIH
jgi:hypothetical protein